MASREQINKWALEYYYRNKKLCAERSKNWRSNNKQYIIQKQKEDKRKRKEEAIIYLGGVCKKCGGNFHPSVYEFHHLNPEDKDRDPSKMLQLSWKRLSAELDKCILLCANCHRLVHHEKNYE